VLGYKAVEARERPESGGFPPHQQRWAIHARAWCGPCPFGYAAPGSGPRAHRLRMIMEESTMKVIQYATATPPVACGFTQLSCRPS